MEHFDDWAAIEAAADGKLDREARPLIFERLSWFRLVAAHAPPPGRPFALRAHDGASTAWLFLAIDGRQAHAFANWYSLRFGAIGDDPRLLRSLASALRDQRPGLDRISLYPLVQDGPLPAAFRAAGWITRVEAASTSWTIDTRGMDFDGYWATRGSRLRNTAKRKAKAAGLDIVVHRAFDSDAWADYEAVYAASWKPSEGSPAFLRALAEQEGQAGSLRLGIARREGRPIAAQLWLVEAGTATIHKLAYAEDARDLSPGTVLSVEMFRHALDVDRVERIDFGTGNDGYKADWMERSAPLDRLVCHNPRTAAGILGALRARASKLVRRA